MNLFWLFIILILYSATDAAMDYINFALGTKDFWHLLKYLDRLFLLASGFSLAKIPSYEWKHLKWYWWVLIAIIILILLKLIIWNTVYYTLRPQLTWLHNNCHISTGVYWIDKFLGFHQP